VIIDEELGQDIVDNKDSKESRDKEEEKRVVVNEIIGKIDPILQEVQYLTIKLNEISQKVTNIEQVVVTIG
ncbi:flagellar assembly protein FliH, partial [Aliarcobacter butzleri]